MKGCYMLCSAFVVGLYSQFSKDTLYGLSNPS